MRSFKILIIVSAIFLVCVTSLFAQRGFNLSSGLNGFRGIKWGTDISSLSGMQYHTEDKERGVKYYRKEGDELKIGEANLNNIWYGFWNAKFLEVSIFCSRENFDNLKSAAFTIFGSVRPDREGNYSWYGEQTDMILMNFERQGGGGLLSMYSNEIYEQRRKQMEIQKKGF